MNQILNQILVIFELFRMAPIPTIDRYEQEGKAIFAQKVEGFMSRYEPIQFFMLGYPFKSMNRRDKVIGSLPDLGEQLSLQNFGRFNDAIQEVYPPGVMINIASDGYAFNDILGEFDYAVKEYQQINEEYAKGHPIRIYNLTDFYTGFRGRLADLREHFMLQWSISEAELQNRILNEPDTTMLYRGMSIFMEEELAIKPYNSRNQMHKQAKILTREMMRRNEAFGALVLHEFKDAIKLSMHQSTNVKKFAFNLYPGNTVVHGSPWHTVILVKENGSMETIKRKEAVNAGYEVIWENNRPFYFLQS